MRRIKRLFLLLAALDLALFIGSVVVALRLKQTRVNSGDEDSNEFDRSTIFDGLEFKSRAPAFRHGSWLGYFGGGEIDLCAARLDPAGATLRLRAVMGGGEVTVPAGCRIELKSRAIMGGVQNDAGEPEEGAGVPTLAIDAFTLMGGFHIVRGEAAEEVQSSARSDGGSPEPLAV